MNHRITLNSVAAGLLLTSSVFAQAPPPPSGPTITESSRVRAFNVCPGGEICSLYLTNGSVVDVGPGIGSRLTAAIGRGTRLTVTGTRAEVKGQVIVAANQITVNGQRFDAARLDAGSVSATAAAPPPPPAGGPGGPPPPPGRADGPPPPPPMRDRGPCTVPPPHPAQPGAPASPANQ